MTDRELMQMAYNALGMNTDCQEFVIKTAHLLEERLAQPEPEPVALINVEKQKLEWAKPMYWNTPTVVKMDKIPLYTAPPNKEWVGLTDEEINLIYAEPQTHIGQYAKAIEAKLKEKNT